MASWTDNPAQFTPYVQQQPIEAMVSVGTEKQRRYDQGVQRIQSSIDRVAGLDIARPNDKQYLQGKLDELSDKLKFVAAGDFSDYQLVNSATGMTSKVGNDRNIQNAVISTARYKSELQKMEADREEGELDPSNELHFGKQANQWFNNDEVGASFKGKYVPHFDVFGFVKETFDEVKPDGMTIDKIFELGADGKPRTDKNGNLIYSSYMTRVEKEGRSTEKVEATLAQIFSDPRVAQQLDISGQYVYKDLNSEGLRLMLSRQKQDITSSYDEEINKRLLDKGSAKTDEEKQRVQQIIDKLRSEKSKVGEVYSQYEHQAFENPDVARSHLYRDDVRNRYTTMFGHMSTSTKIMDSPPYKQMFAEQKEINDNKQWLATFEQRERFHQDRIRMDQQSLEAEREGDVSEGREYTTTDIPSNLDMIKTFKSKYDGAASNLRSSTDDFIWEMIFANDESGYYSDRLATLKAREGIDDSGAMGIIIAEEAQKVGKPVDEYKTEWMSRAMAKYENMSPEEKNENYIIGRKYENYRKSKRQFESMKAAKAKVNDVLAEDKARIGEELDLLDVQPQTVMLDSGEEVILSTDDIYDLAAYANGSTDLLIGKSKEQRDKRKEEALEAANRLRERGKGDVLDYFKDEHITGASKVGRIVGTIKDVGEGLTNPNVLLDMWAGGNDWSQVFGTLGVLNSSEYDEILDKQANTIQQLLSMSPPQTTPVLTGNMETDRNYLTKLASFAGAYKTGQDSNESSDFKDFEVDLESPQSNRFTAHISRVDGRPKVEIIQYDEDNKRTGGMTITPEQAKQLNIDVNELFEPPEIVNLRNTITLKGGKTSAGDIKSKTTYLGDGDYYYGKYDFPKISSSPVYDAKANIRMSDGVFSPYVYMSNGKTDAVIELPGHGHLTNLITALKNEISPALIDKYLSERNGR